MLLICTMPDSIVLNPCRTAFPCTPYQKQDAGQDERQAQPLSHVENHAGLEGGLILLDEFYEKPHAEEDDEENAEDGAGAQPVESGAVQPQEDKAEDAVAEGLVYLGGVMRQAVSPGVSYEDEAPRKVRICAVYLRVHEVAQAYHHAGETDGNNEAVDDLDISEAVFPAVFVHVPPHGQQYAYSSSVRGQAAFPGHQYLPGMGQVVFRVVEQAMPQPGADDSSYEECNQKRVQRLGRQALPSVE